MENEQTQKYQNFISAQNFPEDPKNTRIRILYPKIRRAYLSLCYGITTPRGAILTAVFIFRSFAFCMTKRLSPQVEVKPRKTKENGIFHIRENVSHSSLRRKSLTLKPISTQGISEKLLKNGKHKSPPRHTFMWRLA